MRLNCGVLDSENQYNITFYAIKDNVKLQLSMDVNYNFRWMWIAAFDGCI